MRNASLFRRRTLVLALVATAFAMAAVGAAVAAATSSTPAGGSIHVFGTSPGTGGGGKVVLTGAIGDHGTSRTVNKAGKPESNGSYVKLILTQGTILLNKSKLDAKIGRALGSAVVNSATCSVAVAASAPLPAVGGTGLYMGISGTAQITVSVGFVLPRHTSGAHAGQCNESNSAQPAASLELVYGTGTVNFS
jgi:hypothetical protein